MKQEDLEQQICQIDAFSGAPETKDLLRDLLGHEDTDIGDLATTIERDIALSTHLLRLANSAYFGFPRKVATVHEAVMIMGLRNVSDLVSSLAVASNAHHFSGHGMVDLRQLWAHAAASAEAARLVARTTRGPSELAYTAGLLHDIGMLALATVMPDEYRKVLDHSSEENVRVLDAERELLGVDHEWAGAVLLTHWEFPKAVIEAASAHHEPSPEAGALTMVTAAANVLASAEGLQEPHQKIDIPQIPPVVREALAITDAMYEELVTATHERREAIELIAGEALVASQ